MSGGAALRLRRSISPAGALVLTLAALSPAASMFVTGGAVLHLAGTGAALAMIGGGATVMVATLLYAELGAAYPHAGGLYHGIGEVLGPRYRATAMALGLVTAPALLAFAALGFAAYVRALLPDVPTLALAIGAIALATGVGALRLREGLKVTGALLAAELAALLILTGLEWRRPARGLGAVLLHPAVVDPHGALVPAGTIALALATISAAYACSGSNLALNFAEEIEGDKRLIGQVVIVGGVLATALVALPLVAVTMGTPHLAAVLADQAPIAASVSALAGPRAAQLLAAVVALAIFGHIAGAMLAYSRLVFATARSLGGTHGPLAAVAGLDRFSGAPIAASIALGGVATMLTLFGERVLLLLVSGEIITPALMTVAVLVGRRRGQTGATSYRSPLYPVLPCMGLAITMVFLAADLIDPQARLSVLFLLTCAVLAATLYGRRAG